MPSIACEVTVSATSYPSDNDCENTLNLSLANRGRYGWIEARIKHNAVTGKTTVDATDDLQLSAKDREALVLLIWQAHRHDADRLDGEEATRFIPTLETWLNQRPSPIKAMELWRSLLDALGRHGFYVLGEPLRSS